MASRSSYPNLVGASQLPRLNKKKKEKATAKKPKPPKRKKKKLSKRGY